MNVAELRQTRRERSLRPIGSTLLTAAALVCCIAAAVCTCAVAESDPTVDLHIGMGIYYQVWNMRTAARDHFEEAWEKTGGDPEVAIAAAVASYQGGDFSSALQWIKKVRSDSPEYPIALCLEGAIYMRQADLSFAGILGSRPESLHALAERRFTDALALRNDLAFARHMLARVYARRGEAQRALALLLEIPEADRIDAVSDLIETLRMR
jgi:tetratricopeptide (TPR) repeat protein